MTSLSGETALCAEICLDAYKTVSSSAMRSIMSGTATRGNGPHIRVMLECADVCKTTARAILLDDSQSPRLCAECADLCDRCAEGCEHLSGMEDCVAICNECAERLLVKARLLH